MRWHPSLATGIALLLSVCSQAASARPRFGGGPGNVNLPHNVNDNSGNQWMIYQGGWIQQQGNQPLYSQGAMLNINSNQPAQRNNQARFDDKTGELVFENMQAGPITVTRRILINKEESYARYIDVLKNTQGQEQSVNVQIVSNVNFGVDAAQSIADPRRKQDIAWVCPNGNGKAVLEIYAGKGSKMVPTITFQPGNTNVQGTMQVTIPAGKEVAIMHLHVVTDTPESATRFVQNMREGKILATLPPALRKQIINFSSGQGFVGDREVLRGDLFDVVEIRGGDQMRGTLKEKAYTLNTFYGAVNLPADRVVGLINVGDFRPRQLLVTSDGEIFGGKLAKETIDLELTSGQVTQIPLSQITRFGYRKRGGEPEEWTFDQPYVVLRSGDRVGIQMPANPVEIVTRYGTIKLDPKSIATIQFQAEDQPVHEVYLTDGSKFAGLVNVPQFDMKLSGSIGAPPGSTTAPTTAAAEATPIPEQTVSFPASSVAKIQFTGPPVEVDDGESPTLVLSNDDVLVGALTEKLKLDTAFDTLTLNASEIKKLTRDKDAPLDVQVTLWDASVLSGQLEEPTLKCQLDSGVAVTVPLGLIQEYNQPQPQPAPAIIEKIKVTVAQLNADDWKQRDRAEAELTSMGPVVSGVLKQLRPSQPPEAQQRIDQILANLAKKKT